jgi:hypothetical protein
VILQVYALNRRVYPTSPRKRGEVIKHSRRFNS